jgi:hypothetical protein
MNPSFVSLNKCLTLLAVLGCLCSAAAWSQEPDLPPLPASPRVVPDEDDERSKTTGVRPSRSNQNQAASPAFSPTGGPKAGASTPALAPGRPTSPGSRDVAPVPEASPANSRRAANLRQQTGRMFGVGQTVESPAVPAQVPNAGPANATLPQIDPAIGGSSPATTLSSSSLAVSSSDTDVSRTYYQGGFFQNQATPGLTPDTIPSEGAPGSLYSNTPFLGRLFDAYFPSEAEKAREKAVADSKEAAPSRRASLPPAFTSNSPPFPFSEYIGPNIGVNDTSVYPLMNALYDGPNGDWWKKSRFKIYGWFDPSYNASTSKNSNVPLSYSIVPNHIELSQAILIFERTIDTVQQDEFQIGGKFTNLYGMDYRYTTAKGYFSDQLLKHNNLYGYDPLQMFIDMYFPHVAQGMLVRAGRYISPIDIEAQLSPENYLYTHSLMYTYDPYTFTGVQFITALNDQWSLTVGAHAGNDMAPWTTSSQANGEILLKWVSKDGKNSLYGGLDSIGHGFYQNGHDDLQVLAMTWSHKFNEKFHTLTEAYYIWERNALVGGTITNGNPQPYFEDVGAGARIPGLAYSIGAVNYTAYKLTDKSYAVFRSDVLEDPTGFRTGIPGCYFEHTLGMTYHPTNWLSIRPEVRFDYTSGAKAYDNGTRREQFTFSTDFIIKF